MSMRNYAVDDYGIVLSMDDLRRICAKVLQEDISDEEWEIDAYGFIDSVRGKIDICSCGDFTGKALRIDIDGTDNYIDTITFSDDEVFYIAIRKYPTLFSGAYESFKDMVLDFKNIMFKYVPDNFDFSNVRHIVGT